MHKSFYASGFIYHSPSGQILLQQLTTGDSTKLVLFREKSSKGKDPLVVFRQCIEKALGVSINTSSIHPVYDYVHDKLGEQFIFYVDVSNVAPIAYSAKNKTEWCLLSRLSKYSMNEQTRHDIIIGERVIRSLTEPAS